MGILVLAAAVGPAFAENETPVLSAAEREAMDLEMARLLENRKTPIKAGGPITCGDDYCSGAYSDLFTHRYEADSGQSGIGLTAAAEAFVAVSSHTCLYNHAIILKSGSNSDANKNATVSRWLAELMLAELLDRRVEIRWKQSNFAGWEVCIVERFVIHP